MNETASEETALGQEDPERGWGARLENARTAAGALLGTRGAIFKEELAGKTRRLARAAAGLGLALALSLLTLFVLTALLGALFARLFDSAILGILTLFLLYAAAAAATGVFAWKALSRVKIGDFPVTKEELRKDWEAVQTARKADEEGEGEEMEHTERAAGLSERADADLESRFRAGAE